MREKLKREIAPLLSCNKNKNLGNGTGNNNDSKNNGASNNNNGLENVPVPERNNSVEEQPNGAARVTGGLGALGGEL